MGGLGNIVKDVVGIAANAFFPGAGLLTNALFDAFMKNGSSSSQGSGNGILGGLMQSLLGGGSGSSGDSGVGNLLGMAGSGAMDWMSSFL